MTTHQNQRRAFLKLLLAASVLPARTIAQQAKPAPAFEARTDGYHVYPGGSIQEALEAAARDRERKAVYVHAGTYRPSAPGQAMIWFNARHDGLTVEAVGDVTLTAANPALAGPDAPSRPAIVNHVVYFGDEVSRKTIFRGFKITGANNFTTAPGKSRRSNPTM